MTGFEAYIFESKLNTLTDSMLKMMDSSARLTWPHWALLNSEEEDALLEESGQSEFDPTERIFSEETNLESGELPYEDLFEDTEGCGAKGNKGVTKRVNSACTKRLAKEQFSSIQNTSVQKIAIFWKFLGWILSYGTTCKTRQKAESVPFSPSRRT